MRKFIGMLGAAAMLTIVPATPALAEGSIVVNGDECSGFVPTEDGEFDPDALLTTTDSHQVKRGNWVTVTCHFDIPEGLEPAKATRAYGVECTIPGYGPTTDTRMSASPGGRAVGTCRIRL